MNIEKYIPELLHEHDCVIIPGFGGFIGNYLHARIHPQNHTFLPPSKALLFNVNLTHNDGLLASRITRKENISYEEAMDGIHRMVDTWNSHLRDDHFLEIEMIGRLTRNNEGNLQFEQDNSLNFLPDSFGLSSFVSPAIRRITVQEKIDKKITQYVEAPAAKRRLIPAPLKWAAILALPIGLSAYMGFTHLNTIKNLKVSYSGLFYSAPAPSSAKAPAGSIYLIPKKPNLPVRPSVQTSNPAQTQQVKETPETVPSSGETKPFSVIVGAFRLHENADKLVSDLRQKGFDAQIIDTTKTGLFRVSIGNTADREKALQLLASVRTGEFSAAWLLAR